MNKLFVSIVLILLVSVPVFGQSFLDKFNEKFQNVNEDFYRGNLITGKVVSNQNLISQYHMDDLSGGIIDSSGNNANLIGGGVVYGEAGKLNKAINFKYNIARGTISRATEKLTIAFWIKFDQDIISTSRQISDFRGQKIGITKKTSDIGILNYFFPVRLSNGDYPSFQGNFGEIQKNKWYFVAAIYDQQYLKFYLYDESKNIVGSPQTIQAQGNLDLQSNSIVVGNFNGGGYLDEYHVFDKALSESEILDLINELSGGVTTTDGTTGRQTVLQLKMDGQPITDTSGNSRTINLAGSPKFGEAGKVSSAINLKNNDRITTSFTLPSNQMSLGFWLKINEINGEESIIDVGRETKIILDERSDGKVGLKFSFKTSTKDITYNFFPSENQVRTVNLGEWNFISLVYDGTNINTFVNGNKKRSSAITGPIKYDDNKFTIGNNDVDFVIDEVNYYNYALTDPEVASLYTSLNGVLIPAVRTLTVLKQGDGKGSVRSEPKGFTQNTDSLTETYCGDGVFSCVRDFETGSTVVLYAQEKTGSIFNRWEGCTRVSDSNPERCEVEMNDPKIAIAVFDAVKKRLTVTPPATGSIFGNGITCPGICELDYNLGSEFSLSANIEPGSTITWNGCDSVSSNTCQLTMNDERTVSTVITAPLRRISVTKDGNGEGTISSSRAGTSGERINNCGNVGGVCVASFDSSTVTASNPLHLTANAGEGVSITWTGCQSTGNICTITNLNSDLIISATFTVKYGCNSAGQCVVDLNGIYNSLGCNNGCIPAPKYKCSNGQCSQDATGSYSSLTDCNSACTQQLSCTNNDYLPCTTIWSDCTGTQNRECPKVNQNCQDPEGDDKKLFTQPCTVASNVCTDADYNCDNINWGACTTTSGTSGTQTKTCQKRTGLICTPDSKAFTQSCTLTSTGEEGPREAPDRNNCNDGVDNDDDDKTDSEDSGCSRRIIGGNELFSCVVNCYITGFNTCTNDINICKQELRQCTRGCREQHRGSSAATNTDGLTGAPTGNSDNTNTNSGDGTGT